MGQILIMPLDGEVIVVVVCDVVIFVFAFILLFFQLLLSCEKVCEQLEPAQVIVGSRYTRLAELKTKLTPGHTIARMSSWQRCLVDY